MQLLHFSQTCTQNKYLMAFTCQCRLKYYGKQTNNGLSLPKQARLIHRTNKEWLFWPRQIKLNRKQTINGFQLPRQTKLLHKLNNYCVHRNSAQLFIDALLLHSSHCWIVYFKPRQFVDPLKSYKSTYIACTHISAPR